MIERPVDARALAKVLAVGFVIRAFVAALTPVPAEDGANYLWMAQQLARGDAAAALSEVFPPLWPLVATPFVWIGSDAFRMGQLAAVLAGTLSIVPAVGIVRHFAPSYAIAIGWLAALAPLPVRFGAECYSEPVFHVVGAAAVLAGLRERHLLLGVLSGLAAWARPEGVLIAIAFVLVRPRRAWPALIALGVPLLLLAAWRDAVGLPFTWVAKLDFNLVRDDVALGAEGLEPLRFLEHVVAVPGIWLEAFVVPGVVAIFGLTVAGARSGVRPLTVLLALGVLVVVLFVPRRRFLVSWIFVLWPFVALGFERLPGRARLPVWVLAVVTSLLLCLRTQEHDRHAERVVGEYLATRLAPSEVVEGDMTRVLWFAGMRPLPPRHFTAAEMAERIRGSDARFAVLGARRDTTPPTVRSLDGDYRRHALPEKVRVLAELRGILVLERRE